MLRQCVRAGLGKDLVPKSTCDLINVNKACQDPRERWQGGGGSQDYAGASGFSPPFHFSIQICCMLYRVNSMTQVETYGSMERQEKVELILEQMRLCLLTQDYIRFI